jgi:hypothetical protein
MLREYQASRADGTVALPVGINALSYLAVCDEIKAYVMLVNG